MVLYGHVSSTSYFKLFLKKVVAALTLILLRSIAISSVFPTNQEKNNIENKNEKNNEE